MLRKLYYWKIPGNLRAEFAGEWESLTLEAQEQFGLISAMLATDEELVFSLTLWPSQESWDHWKKDLEKHPLRKKWRKYQVNKNYDVTMLAEVAARPKVHAIHRAIQSAGADLYLNELFTAELITSEKIKGAFHMRRVIINALTDSPYFQLQKLSDLLLLTEKELKEIPKLGSEAHRIIKAVLAHYKLRLREP